MKYRRPAWIVLVALIALAGIGTINSVFSQPAVGESTMDFAALPGAPQFYKGQRQEREEVKKPPMGETTSMGQPNVDKGLGRADSRMDGVKWVGDPAPGYDTFANAVDTLNADGKDWTLIVPRGKHPVSKDLSVKANIHVVVQKGAIISLANAKTLNINGSLEAGPYQIFSRTGTGTVQYGPGSVKEALLRWYGCIGDGVTDDSAAFQWALHSIYHNNHSHVGLGGSPGDIYRVSNISYAPGGEDPINLDGHGATLKLANPKDTHLLKFSGFGYNGAIRNWKFQALGNVWKSADTVGAKPSRVTVNGVAATEKSSLAALDNPPLDTDHWWWWDSSAHKLFVSLRTGLDKYPDDAVEHGPIVADGTTIHNWTRVLCSVGLWFYDGGPCIVENCRFYGFDRGLVLQGMEWGLFDSLMFWTCDQAIYIHAGGSSAIQNIFRNIYLRGIYSWTHDGAVQIDNGTALHFDGVDAEMIRGRQFNVPATGMVEALKIEGVYSEGNGYMLDGTATEMFAFGTPPAGGGNLNTVSVDNCVLWIAQTNKAVSYTRMFYFGEGCQGAEIKNSSINIANTWQPTPITSALYYAEPNVKIMGIIFRNNMLNIDAATTIGDAVALLEGNTWINSNRQYTMNASLVKPGQPSAEAATNPTFTQKPTVTTSNCTAVWDKTTGYNDSNSVKLTFSDAHGTANIANYFITTTAGYAVCSLFFKSDSDQWFQIVGTGIAASPWVFSKGDGLWRGLYWFTNVTTPPGNWDLQIKGYANYTGHNLWIDAVSCKVFGSRNEAVQWVGKTDPVAPKPSGP